MNFNEILQVSSIEHLTELLGFPSPRHPLISVCRLEDIRPFEPIGVPVCINLYSIVMKDGSQCTKGRYGWRDYDFQSGLLSFFAPGQVHFWVERGERVETAKEGWIINFHPDYIRSSALGKEIAKYRFFDYEANEALHMSDEEQRQMQQLIENIYTEYQHAIDEHSHAIIVSQLDVLLNYSQRYYTRQFRTRQIVETSVVTQFNAILRSRYGQKMTRLVKVEDIATEMNMSAGYLSDLMKTATGQNAQQHIHSYLIERAKTLLKTTTLSVNEIAYQLGFDYPQYFSRLFKQKVGTTPLKFREGVA
jgi:AraC-like DNA-binding protein